MVRMNERFRRFSRKLKEEGTENFVVSKQSNLFYLLDRYHLSGFLLFRGGESVLITSKFFRYSVEDLGVEALIYPDSTERDNIFQDLDIDGEIFSDSPTRLESFPADVEKSDLLERTRRRKSEKEVERMRKAGDVAVNAMEAVKRETREERTEWELASVIDGEIRRSGCYNAFETLVHSETTEPHRSLRKKRVGDGLIIVDFGAKYRGYCSDMTRTFCLDPDEKERELYEDVLEIYRKALEKIRPGAKFCEVVEDVEGIVDDMGYSPEKNFIHSLGHSLGVEIHEEPGFRLEEDTEIKEGMVFTVEPGLYMPDVGGVRIEDTVHVKKNGEVDILTDSPRELEL